MTTKLLWLAATAMALAPTLASAAPGGNGSTSNGSTQGVGYDHMNGPTSTGQPDQSCEDLGTRPGNAESAPGSAFNPDGVAGSVYAGNQAQSQRNTASVSQYDVACLHQPQ